MTPPRVLEQSHPHPPGTPTPWECERGLRLALALGSGERDTNGLRRKQGRSDSLGFSFPSSSAVFGAPPSRSSDFLRQSSGSGLNAEDCSRRFSPEKSSRGPRAADVSPDPSLVYPHVGLRPTKPFPFHFVRSPPASIIKSCFITEDCVWG